MFATEITEGTEKSGDWGREGRYGVGGGEDEEKSEVMEGGREDREPSPNFGGRPSPSRLGEGGREDPMRRRQRIGAPGAAHRSGESWHPAFGYLGEIILGYVDRFGIAKGEGVEHPVAFVVDWCAWYKLLCLLVCEEHLVSWHGVVERAS